MHFAKCHNCECRILFSVMPSVNVLSVITMSVAMLSVIMLSAMAPIS
jgi:hypothetical protein